MPPRLTLAIALALMAGPALAQDLPTLRRGDLIFQTSVSDQSTAILEATGSPYTHVGIVDFDASGALVVLEAAATTRATPISQWIDRGRDRKIAIYRLDGLTELEARKVAEAARHQFGKPYDPWFHASPEALYCSELVQIAFRDALGLELGQTERLGDLDLAATEALKLVEARWQSHPSCDKGQARDAQDCLARIAEEPILTPRALAEDDRLQRIHSTFD